MKQLVATIVAIEERRAMADALFAQVNAALPGRAAIFYAAPPYNDHNAVVNSRAALEHAALAGADWHLFLEDDQALYPAFWELLPKLLALADARDVQALYLSNRRITYAKQELIDGFVLNRITQPVHGTHGLLYRTAYIPKWLDSLQGDTAIPMDDIFWSVVEPTSGGLVCQVVAPVLAQHIGAKSTLHDYDGSAHLLLNSVEPALLTAVHR